MMAIYSTISTMHFAWALLAVVTIRIVWQVLHNVLLSPLRQIPGPLLAKTTTKWLTLIDFMGIRTRTIHKLHQSYGPIVQVGPHEVSCTSEESIKHIYSTTSDFIKAPVYEHFKVDPNGPHNIFTMRYKADHGRRRRLLSHAFSQTSLHNSQAAIAEQIEKTMARIENAQERPLNAVGLFRSWAFDTIGGLFLGGSFGALDSVEAPPLMADLDLAFLLSGIQLNMPLVYHVLMLIPVASVRYFMNARQRFAAAGKTALERYIDLYGRRPDRKDLLAKMLYVEGEDQDLSDLDVYTELGGIIFAGTDTTSTTLVYLLWELARNPEWQDRLHEELQQRAATSVPEFSTLADLPVLRAVVDEALRLHPAAPGSLPRETPAGGFVLDGIFIPQKTIVSAQCYTVQRNPAIFNEPESFNPQRWLKSDNASAMRVAMLPFSRGSRACIAQHLALMELKLMTACIVDRYNISLAPSTTEDSMAMMDHFVAMPKSGKCELIFTKRAKG